MKSITGLQGLLGGKSLTLANLYRQCRYYNELVSQVKAVIDPLVSFDYVVGHYQNAGLCVYVADHSQGQFMGFHKQFIMQGLAAIPLFADLTKFRLVVDPTLFVSGFASDFNPEVDQLHTKPELAVINNVSVQLIRQSARRVTNQNLARQLDNLAVTLQPG